MRTRQIWKFPWFPHIPGVVSWNVFNCYNHVVAHQEAGANLLRSVQTPNTPISSADFPRVFQPLIVLIQSDVKSLQWKAWSSASNFYRLKYKLTHHISIKHYEHGWKKMGRLHLSPYCRISPRVKISTCPFLILQCPLVRPVLFRSLTRDFCDVCSGGGGGEANITLLPS